MTSINVTADTMRLLRRHCRERGGEVQGKVFEKTSISFVARGRLGEKGKERENINENIQRSNQRKSKSQFNWVK